MEMNDLSVMDVYPHYVVFRNCSRDNQVHVLGRQRQIFSLRVKINEGILLRLWSLRAPWCGFRLKEGSTPATV